MNTSMLERKFESIGARLKVQAAQPSWRTQPFRLNIGRDQKGEYFDIQVFDQSSVEMDVVDLRAKMRHLLLLARDAGEKQKFLCGHDERQWFVAAVPGHRGVTNVFTAMEALKPWAVKASQTKHRVKFEERTLRKTSAYVRQGEWFFVPEPWISVDERLVLRNEPLIRGRGKPHMAQFCYRTGGVPVYVSFRYRNGLTASEYEKLLKQKPKLKDLRWVMMRRNPVVYVRGTVSHLDHKTIVLSGWHRVQMNTEHEAPAMANVAFLD